MMKILSGVAVGCLFAIGLAAPANAIVIYNSTSAGTNNQDLDVDITATYGVLAVPPAGEPPEVYQIERIRFREIVGGGTTGPRLDPDFMVDRFKFTVDSDATSLAAFQSLILSNTIGMQNITLSVIDVASAVTIASGFATGLNEDNNDIALSAFNLFEYPPAEYVIEIMAQVTGLRSGQYNLAMSVFDQIPAIPLPPALLLFGSAIAGLMGFAGFRRKPEELDQA